MLVEDARLDAGNYGTIFVSNRFADGHRRLLVTILQDHNLREFDAESM